MSTSMARLTAGSIPLLLIMQCVADCGAEDVTQTDQRGVYSVGGQLHVNTFGTPEQQPITSGHRDMKASWSKTGDKIVFFRVTRLALKIARWKTAICVINSDGTGFRALTDGSHSDFNPTWTRDGKNRIVFSRYHSREKRSEIYVTTADAARGDEQRVSDPAHSEYAFSCLQDGRIFVLSRRENAGEQYFLLTPGKDGEGTYEPVRFKFPLEGALRRLSVSPSDTKITYEYCKSWQSFKYTGKTLYIADFDAKTLSVSNAVPITDTSPDSDTITIYPRWTRDESAVVYHSDISGKSQLYMYRLRDRSTIKVSTNPEVNYRYPCGAAAPK